MIPETTDRMGSGKQGDGRRLPVFISLQKGVPTCDINKLASSSYFNFSEKFLTKYYPHLMELGRSFVHPDYQSRAMGRKSLFALDNLWDGLGAIIIDNHHLKYLFGKVTMYPHFNQKARNMILYFLKKHFNDPDNLVIPKDPANIDLHEDEMKKIFRGWRYKENYKILSREVRNLNENIPPLINAYMGSFTDNENIRHIYKS